MKVDIQKEIRKKALKKQGTFRAQIPVRLLLDRRISDGAIRQYGIYHSYCPDKRIEEGKSQTFVSQQTVADDVGCTTKTVKKRQKELEITNWINVSKRKSRFGTNIITLNIRPMKRRKKEISTGRK